MKREPRTAYGWAWYFETGYIWWGKITRQRFTLNRHRPGIPGVPAKLKSVAIIPRAKHRHHTRLKKLCESLMSVVPRDAPMLGGMFPVIRAIRAELERQKGKE